MDTPNVRTAWEEVEAQTRHAPCPPWPGAVRDSGDREHWDGGWTLPVGGSDED